MLRFQRESIKRRHSSSDFNSTRLMIKKAASPTQFLRTPAPTCQDSGLHPGGWPSGLQGSLLPLDPKERGSPLLVPVVGWGVGVEYGHLASPKGNQPPDPGMAALSGGFRPPLPKSLSCRGKSLSAGPSFCSQPGGPRLSWCPSSPSLSPHLRESPHSAQEGKTPSTPSLPLTNPHTRNSGSHCSPRSPSAPFTKKGETKINSCHFLPSKCPACPLHCIRF